MCTKIVSISSTTSKNKVSVVSRKKIKFPLMAVGTLIFFIVFCHCLIGSTSLVMGNTVGVGGGIGRGIEIDMRSKRHFLDIRCKGIYNKELFGELDRVCEDCYNLYEDPQIYRACRWKCFGSKYFKGCLDALLLNEEEDKYDDMIEILGKK